MEKVTFRRKKRIDRGIKIRTDGLYAISSWKELLYLAGPRLALILAILLIPLITSPFPYWQRVFTVVILYALLAISFDFLMNFVGLVCLGGALFVGIGGYMSAILNSWAGLPAPLSILIATVAGAALSTVLLLPVLKLRRVYFAIATFMYPLLFATLIEATQILGGTEGIRGIDPLSPGWFELYLGVGVLLIALFGLRRLVNQDIGLVFRGIRDNDLSVTASGINVTYRRAQGLFIAAILGCFVGAYFCHLYQWAGMSLFAIDYSIMPIAAAVTGGMGTLAGPVLGAYILIPISEWLRRFGTLRIVFYSLVIILIMMFWSEGLLNWARRKYEQVEYWTEA